MPHQAIRGRRALNVIDKIFLASNANANGRGGGDPTIGSCQMQMDRPLPTLQRDPLSRTNRASKIPLQHADGEVPKVASQNEL